MTAGGLVIDLFCGGGGASEGIEQALGRAVDIGVNHDPEAIRLHMVNHPETLHLTEDIFTVDLEKYVAGRPVALMWASPDCTQFSRAKGGKPREHGIRTLPWAVHMHAEKIRPAVVIMENVSEIQSWGDLDERGRPVEKDKGREYLRFMAAMAALGYRYETWELVAADYGAPTTRKRWYAVFRRDGRPVIYPEATHSKEPTLFEDTARWIPCGRFVDWSDTGESIFTRKKPLADKTLRRIANGVKKFIFEAEKPYILSEKDAAAFLIQYHSETGSDVRGQALDKPVATLDTSNRYGLVSAFITKFYKSGTGQTCGEPLHTITTSPGHFGIVAPFLTTYYGNEAQASSMAEPLRTITTKDRFSMVAAFLMRYYGDNNGKALQAQSLNDPLGTVTTRERFGLVTVGGENYRIADIRLRMLKPEELKLMQGFPAGYVIDRDIDGRAISRKEQVAKIGNSVVPQVARALVRANCPYLCTGG